MESANGNDTQATSNNPAVDAQEALAQLKDFTAPNKETGLTIDNLLAKINAVDPREAAREPNIKIARKEIQHAVIWAHFRTAQHCLDSLQKNNFASLEAVNSVHQLLLDSLYEAKATPDDLGKKEGHNAVAAALAAAQAKVRTATLQRRGIPLPESDGGRSIGGNNNIISLKRFKSGSDSCNE